MYKTARTTINLTKIIYTGLGLLGAFCSTVVFATEGERHISLQQDVASAELIRLSVPAGDVDIVGITGNNLVAEVTAVCKDEERQACLNLLNDLGWNKKIGSIAEFSLIPTGLTSFNNVTIKVKIGVPLDKKLEVNVSAGELSITDTSACVKADLNAGEINISLTESQLASASLSANVGDVKLTTINGRTIAGERALLVGANLRWQEGTGSCHTRASVLAGEVNLVLK